ncbi:secreted protein containing Outer membrane protein, OmpA/MotB [Candidatus Magnetomorum sp. HK-1]|nr:secreted protein containing Outer membrane protein, OmpA/MotB [Candidatus Magnetomorum sp. HK-1]
MKSFIKLTAIFAVCIMLSACSFFGKKQLNPGLTSEAVQRVETLLVIFDATETHEDQAFGKKKLDEAKNVLTLLNNELKSLEFTSGLRTVANTTQLIFGLARHNATKFQRAVDSVSTAKGKISMSAAINAAKYDLKSASGNIAVIIISDGLSSNNYALKSAEILGADFGNRISLYTIRVGNHPQGATYMTQLAQKTESGFPMAASALNSPQAMKAFVKSIFFAGVKESLLEMDIQGADADGDGVPNSADQCNRTPEGADVDAEGCWEIHRIFFDWNKADVKPQEKEKLIKATKVFKANSDLRVNLQGHTDDTGDAAYNQRLSEQRAMNVKRVLIKQGVSKKQLTTIGFGFTQPSAPNNSDENRAKNRRVETVVQ